MPHQCLKCGKIFEEGSPELLRGCPNCGGNRFFYTKKPLDEREREKISKEIGKDLYTQIMDLLGDKRELVDETGRWIKVKPKDISKAIKEQLPPSKDKILVKNDREEKIKKLLESPIIPDDPATIGIQPPGKYEIDIKRLLENEPIIIQKDGSYMIHLPSAFRMIKDKD
ncbi:MAG: hypothetical protein DRN12_01065 [Thermoplasmata archaeon]|nr:MAG: hypothetical protein DRN12_01065 [Thermoplasmata archaeon]